MTGEPLTVREGTVDGERRRVLVKDQNLEGGACARDLKKADLERLRVEVIWFRRER